MKGNPNAARRQLRGDDGADAARRTGHERDQWARGS
jgi:hypothetical protein